MKVAIPIGMLMNRIQRQESSSVRTPPRRAPAAPPAPATALHMPIARARACGSRKVVVRIVKVAGDKIAPPRPWAARAEISIAWFWAKPPRRLARVNTVSPTRKIRRRPNRSARRPPRRRKPAKVKV